MFPNDPTLQMINNEILSRCVVRHERECKFVKASDLLSSVDLLIKEITGRQGYVRMVPRYGRVGYAAKGITEISLRPTTSYRVVDKGGRWTTKPHIFRFKYVITVNMRSCFRRTDEILHNF